MPRPRRTANADAPPRPSKPIRRRRVDTTENLVRVFCALEIDDAAKQAVDEGMRPIRISLDRANWIYPGRWHVTVKFFGDNQESGLFELGNDLQTAVGERIPVQLRGAGAFPDLREPQVIWVGVRDSGDGMKNLYRRINDVCVPLGYPPEGRKFRPHITVARLRLSKAFPVARELTPVLDSLFCETEFSKLTLYRSDMHEDGAVYTVLRTMTLAQRVRRPEA